MNRPLILLTNDDGIFSPGLAALCDALLPFGELLVVAPATQQTSAGRSYAKMPDSEKISSVRLCKGVSSFAVTGSPADVVAHAVLELAPRLPSLCISGINYGENLGKTLTYRGTVGAALQAVDFGIPAIAISRPAEHALIDTVDYAPLDWSLAAAVARDWASHVLTQGIPFGAPMLNINVPEQTVDSSMFAFTFQSNEDLFCYDKPAARDFACPYRLPSHKRTDFSSVEKGSDLDVVCVRHMISVTPMEGNYTGFAFREGQATGGAGSRHE